MKVNKNATKDEIKKYLLENKEEIKGKKFKIKLSSEGFNPAIEVTGIGEEAIKYNYTVVWFSVI